MTDNATSSLVPEAAVLMQADKPKPMAIFIRTVFRLLLIVLLVFFAFAILAPGILQNLGIAVNTTILDYGWVMLLGALIGFVEMISRYQDAPFQTVMTWPGLVYMFVNAMVAAAALWTIQLFGWDIIPVADSEPNLERWTKVLVAGLGAMAIFRSSLFNIGKGDEEVSIGPSAVLDILLVAIDKEVDRFRGQKRAQSVKTIMSDIHYDDAISDLILISNALMQNLRDPDNEKIEELKKKMKILSNIDPEVRTFLLGLGIMDVVGEDVLKQAIRIRGKDYYINKKKERLAKTARELQKEVQDTSDARDKLKSIGEDVARSFRAGGAQRDGENGESAPAPGAGQAEDKTPEEKPATVG